MYLGFAAGAAGNAAAAGDGVGTALASPAVFVSATLPVALAGNKVTCDSELSLLSTAAFVRPGPVPSSCANTPLAVLSTSITPISAFFIHFPLSLQPAASWASGLTFLG